MWLELASGGGAANAAAAARRGVGGDLLGTSRRAAGEEPSDLARHLGLKPHVGELALSAGSLAPGRSLGLIREAFLLGAVHSVLLDEYALALVAAAGAAEAHDDGREPAVLAGAARQGGIAAREVHEMVQVGAGEAERSGVLHLQQVTGAATRGTGPVLAG